MNEELIKQPAREGYADLCRKENCHSLADAVVRGEEDDADEVRAAEHAIRLYHARAVAPLVEAVEKYRAAANVHSYVFAGSQDKFTEASEALRAALAPFQKAGAAPTMAQAAADVLAERRRQIEAEGWTPEHDDKWADGQLAAAAASYSLYAYDVNAGNAPNGTPPRWWPFSFDWWKPCDDGTGRRSLVKAGALILAEIERLDRAAAKEARDAAD